jgi:hypothetical protein
MTDLQIAVEHLFTLTLDGLEDHRFDFEGPFGRRAFARASGGQVAGRRLRGKVLPWLATDYGSVSADRTIRQHEADLAIEAEDGGVVLMRYRGRASPTYGPGQSRIHAVFHAAEDGAHHGLNLVQAIGFGREDGGRTVFEIYALTGGEASAPAVAGATGADVTAVPAEFLFRRKSEHTPGAKRHLISHPLGDRYLSVAEGGGAFAGPRLSGEFVAGYSWSPHRTGDHRGERLQHYDVQTLLRATDGAPILMRYLGVGSQAYGAGAWMTATLFEAPPGPHGWLNEVQAVGLGRWAGDGAEYTVCALY